MTTLGDRGGSSCDEDGCHDSGGKDNGDGANSVGDNTTIAVRLLC
jgi:hypothetical protein